MAAHYRELSLAVEEARILNAWRACDARVGQEGALTRRLAVISMDELKDAAQALSLLEELLPEVAHEPEYSGRLVQLYEHSQRWDRLMDLCDAALKSEGRVLSQAAQGSEELGAVAAQAPGDQEAEGEVEESFRFVPAHLSTYTLAGPARHDWQHSVLPGGASGDAEAGVRYSITFREKTLLGSL